MVYQSWGFSTSPFQHTSLPPTEEGSKLLIGRDDQVEALMRRVDDAPKIAVLEGLNGIGKTSIVNVAAYRLYQRHIKSEGPLYIPCPKAFQLSVDVDLQTFIDSVLIEVTQTLLDRRSDLTKTDDGKHLDELNHWLNSPEIKSYQGGVWLLQGGVQKNANPSFDQSGFRKHIQDALSVLFPRANEGGVICCIDNLELLQESEAAKYKLEQLRDVLLQIQGLRWVLCGALGITYGVVSSPRLDGYLHRPIELKEMDKAYAAEILKSRLHVYAESETTYLPITESDFVRLYEIVHGNLRTLLSYTGNYCQAVADGELPQGDEEKNARFTRWLDEEAGTAYEAAKATLTPRTREVFEVATGEGTFSPSDFDKFNFTSLEAFRPYVKNLEEVGLLQSVKDDKDKRRKTIQVTAKGWFVDHFLKSQTKPSATA